MLRNHLNTLKDIQLDKCELLLNGTLFLGHKITTNGIEHNFDKICVIQTFPILKYRKNIKSLLGLTGYYRKCISNFAKISKPLTVCLKKNTEAEHTMQLKKFKKF